MNIYPSDAFFGFAARFNLLLYMAAFFALALYQIYKQDWVWVGVDLFIVISFFVWWIAEGRIIKKQLVALKNSQSDETLMSKVISNRQQQTRMKIR